MDMQNVAKLGIPEGEVRTIHDKDGNLIWGKVNYGVKYKGDTAQNGTPTPSAPIPVQTVTGEQTISINGAAHTVNFGSIELCKIGTYQDYIYKSGGKWYVHKATGKLVVDGSETGWLISASSGSPDYYYARTNAKDGISVSNYYGGYCDRFTNRGTYIQGGDTVSTDVYSLGSPSYSMRMLILGSRLSAMTTAALQTFLTANPATIYYALTTPTDTAITNTALVAQLEAVEQWLTRYGYNATVSGNLPIIIDRTVL